MRSIKSKIVVLMFTVLMCIQINQVQTLAASVTHTVSTVAEFNTAVATINTDGGDHIISLADDIKFQWSTEKSPEITNGNTTIIGNGKKIIFVGNRNGLNLTNGATLTLGDSTDSLNTLDILFEYDSLNSPSQSALITVYGKSTLNMYDGVTIKDNITNGFTFGGGVVVDDSTFNMYGGLITNNEIIVEGVYSGAGIALNNGAVAHIMNNSKITNNTSENNGGAISLMGGSTVNISDNVEISGNKAEASAEVSTGAKWGGGAIFALSSTVNISDSVLFDNNSTNYLGGAIMGHTSSINLKNNTKIQNNKASVYGGGMTITRTDLTVDDTVSIKDNTATTAGNNLFVNTYDNLFTLNTTENLREDREQLIDIRYGSSKGQLDFAITGVGSSSVTKNTHINKYFSYEITSLLFDIETVADHLILVDIPKITPIIVSPSEDLVDTLLFDMVNDERIRMEDGAGNIVAGTFTFYDINTGEEITNPKLIIDDFGNRLNVFGYKFVPDDTVNYEIVDTLLIRINAVYPKLDTPEIQIDFINETLINYDASLNYSINSNTSASAGSINWTLDDSAFGTNMTFKSSLALHQDSDVQTLLIPKRPSAPSVVVNANGIITNVGETIEYSINGGTSWITVSGNQISGLAEGQNVLIRTKATNSNFKGEITSITISSTTTPPTNPPEHENPDTSVLDTDIMVSETGILIVVVACGVTFEIANKRNKIKKYK